jgi:biotin carboxylase
MNNLKGRMAIEKLARQRGISIQEIKDEINIAIEMGMRNPDISVQQYWRKIPCKGAKPTPEELITYFSKQVEK